MENGLRITMPDATVDESFPGLGQLTQSYLILKQKICETHDIIKQYNDKQKDCERLQTELETMKKQTRKMAQDYHTALRKSIKLEQQNAECKKEMETLSTKVADHEIKVAADKQHIQQLVCKIKDMDQQHSAKMMESNLEKSSFEVKVKELEQELKVVRKSHDTVMKKMEKMEKKSPVNNGNSKCNKIPEKVKTSEVGVNTTCIDVTPVEKCEVAEKYVMTTESYATKEDVYPIFCAKCDVLLDPPPIEKICRVMSIDYPLIEEISSPPKKTSSPMRVPPDINSGYCKPKNVSNVPGTASSAEVQSQTNNCDFAPLRLLNLHNSTLLNPTTRSNDLPQISPKVPEIPNQCSYYVNSAAITPLPLSMPSAVNQSNHGDAIMSFVSSIKSLQSRMDTLEIETKKRLSQKKFVQSSNCWQHKHPTTCCIPNANNSFQTNAPFELWKQMTDFYEWNEKKRYDKYKQYVDKKVKRLETRRLKVRERKRLQSVCTKQWRVVSLPERFEESSLRSRTKKRTYRYVRPVNSDFVLNSTENVEKYNSDSDTSTCSNEFSNVVHNDESRCSPKKVSKNVSRMKNLFSTPEKDATIETSSDPTSSDTRVNNVDAQMDASRNLVESNKLLSAETDSGIVSDSVESSRLASTEGARDSTECANVQHSIPNHESMPSSPTGSIGTNKNKEDSIQICSNSDANDVTPLSTLNTNGRSEVIDTEVVTETIQCLDRTAFTPEKQIYVKTASRLFEDDQSSGDDQSEKVENDEAEETVFHSSVDTFSPYKVQCLNRISTGTNSKLNTLKSQKSCGSRQVLQKKLRNLKRCSKALNTHNDLLNNHKTTCEPSNVETSPNPKGLNDNQVRSVNGEDYIPKKKPRVAHVPKCTFAEHNESVIENPTQIDAKVVHDVEKKLHASCKAKSVEDLTVKIQEISSTEFSNNELQKSQPFVSTACENNLSNEGTANNAQINSINTVNTHRILQNTKIYAKPVNTSRTLYKKCKINKINFVRSKDETLEGTSQLNEGSNQRTVECSVTHAESENTADCNGAVSNDDKSMIDDDPGINVIRPRNDVQVHVDRAATPSSESSQCKDNQNNTALITEDNIETRNVGGREDVQQEQTYTNVNSIGTLLEAQEDESKRDVCVSSDTFKNASIGPATTINRVRNETIQNTVNTREEIIRQNIPLVRLTQYINEGKRVGTVGKRERKAPSQILELASRYVEKQFQRLIGNDWEISLHWDIIGQLKPISSPRIIAKCMVDILSTEELYDAPLDNTHTPPAPLMTNMQQRFVALLFDLEKSHPGILKLVQAGIEFKFFRLMKSLQRSVLEALTRIYTVIARIQKDREKVRIFCCDALYCLGLNAITVLYTVFTCWPEVFPNCTTNNDLLPKCIAHLIAAQHATADFPKLNALKKLVSIYYQYPSGTVTQDLLDELLAALEHKSQSSVDTAIILLAKREGTPWTYKNVILNALLPMIINNRLANTYRAFGLLGNLLRAFPTVDEDKSVGNIVEQLCDLINSGEGSEDQQEGVASALLSLSRHKFDKVAVSLINWTPLKPLYPRTVEQIDGFIRMRDTDFWKAYVRKTKETAKN